MKILVKFKNGVSDTYDVTRVSLFSKNPCIKCRPNGGCYEHSCFTSEDWGDFLDIGNGNNLRTQDIENIMILTLY